MHGFLLFFGVFYSLMLVGVQVFGKNAQDSIPVKTDILAKILFDNKHDNTRRGLFVHKPTYFLPITWSSQIDGRQQVETKFQLSVKQRLVVVYDWALFFCYSQKSFWQAFDAKRSRPFRENNFNPEIMLRTRSWQGVWFDLGFEHESNGSMGLLSRSWNRAYLSSTIERKHFVWNLKLWMRMSEDAKASPEDTEGDDNPDIHKYMGNSELLLVARCPRIVARCKLRYVPWYNRGAAQLELIAPMRTNSMSWYLHIWQGYGESMIDYNVNLTKIGLGVVLTY